MKWKFCLFLVTLLLNSITTKAWNQRDDEDDDDDDDEDEEDEHYYDQQGRLTKEAFGKSSTIKCYVCVYDSVNTNKSCFDPIKYSVRTINCISDKCFTHFKARGNEKGFYDLVVRGCRSSCVPSSDTTCCETNKCNDKPVQSIGESADSLTLSP